MRFPKSRLVVSAFQHIGKHNRIHGSHDDHTGINRRNCGQGRRDPRNAPTQIEESCLRYAEVSETTKVSFIVARVAPTKIRRTALSSSVSARPTSGGFGLRESLRRDPLPAKTALKGYRVQRFGGSTWVNVEAHDIFTGPHFCVQRDSRIVAVVGLNVNNIGADLRCHVLNTGATACSPSGSSVGLHWLCAKILEPGVPAGFQRAPEARDATAAASWAHAYRFRFRNRESPSAAKTKPSKSLLTEFMKAVR